MDIMDTQWAIIGEVALAILLGGLIGLERELSRKPAGLRTHMLVAGAAALLVSLSRVIMTEISAEPSAPALIRFDPVRIIEAIVTGLGFIGAGTIIRNTQDKGSIEGLTTAASILFTGAIGISVAIGQFFLASAAAVLVLIVNFGLGRLEMAIAVKKGKNNAVK
jgi:putative Mg2+ transporter-C (MgtC) family protein